VAINTLADAVSFFGPLDVSQGTRAARKYFELGLNNYIGLFALGLDATGWTSNNYTLTVAAGTATESGTLFLRLGSDTLPVAVTKGQDQDAVAAAIDAAINGAPSSVPWTSGVVTNVVTATTTLVGLATNRIDVSVDKYSDRGENGVPGITVAVVNNAVATGEAAALDTTNLGQTTHLWYLHNQVNTAFLDSLATWRDTRWNTENNWFQPIAAFATGQGAESAFTSVIGLRNDTNHTYLAPADSPALELEFVVAQLAALNTEQRERGTVPISTENRVISAQPPTVSWNPDLILQAGGSPYREVNGQTLSVQVVNSRRENAQNEEDLRFFDIALVLSARELLTRIKAMLDGERGKAINTGGPIAPEQAPFVTSEDLVTTKGRAVLVQAWVDQIITAPNQQTVEAVLVGTILVVEGNIAKGFRQQYDPTLTNIARVMEAVVFLQEVVV
jgi:phage tail sheath gpL-like